MPFYAECHLCLVSQISLIMLIVTMLNVIILSVMATLKQFTIILKRSSLERERERKREREREREESKFIEKKFCVFA
jgi:hypothetical protein